MNIRQSIFDAGDFIQMSITAKAAYITLSAWADDDGFIADCEALGVTKKRNQNEIAELIKNAYVIEVGDGLCVICNPHIRQYILETSGNGNAAAKAPAKEKPSEVKKYDWLVQAWNELQQYGVTPIRGISDGGDRIRQVRARVKQYGKDGILEAIKNISESKFLTGNNNRGWVITFDWLFKPSNFQKVIDGNYNKRKPAEAPIQKPEEEEEYINLWDNE